MSTILVTGRNGFIANALVTALKKDHRIISVVRSRKAHIDYSGEDVIDKDLLSLGPADLKDRQIDLVIHAAAMIQGFPDIVEEENVQTSENVFSLAAELNVPVIFFSSANALFADRLGGYARSKKRGEVRLREIELRHLILRVPFVIGKDSPTVQAIRRFGVKSPFFPLFGPERGKTHVVALSSIVDFLLRRIAQKDFSGETVNLISRRLYIYPEIVENILGKRVAFVTFPYGVCIGACRLFEKLRLPFPVNSEQVQSFNIDKVIQGDTDGKTLYVDEDHAKLFHYA